MKIAIFTKYIDSGAFMHVSANMCHTLLLIGIDNIDLVYIEGHIKNIEHYFPSGINFVKLRASRTLFSLFPLLHYILKNKPNFIISMPAYVNMVSIVAKMFARLFCWRGKLLITEHATMSHKILEHKKEFIMGNIDKFARLLYRYADALVGVSEGCIFDLQKNIGLNQPKMYHIPNALNIDLIKKLSLIKEADQLHPWLSKGRTIPCFISVGRLVLQKNYTILLQALKKVNEIYNARLIVIGDGNLKYNLKKLSNDLFLSDKVAFLGFIENPYPYMKAADCFVLSSSEEAFGMVLAESMALGTPVIAFDSIGGGPREILGGGEYGILIKEQNVDSLSKEMVRTINSPNLLSFLRHQGILRANSFSHLTISHNWSKVLKATS